MNAFKTKVKGVNISLASRFRLQEILEAVGNVRVWIDIQGIF